ncbi:MAG: FHA domain-containing protein, partial [Deltaproteobacteria bacterium]|nr:FHA domain-containing protein [Deltaproteobacteria bacterium]
SAVVEKVILDHEIKSSQVADEANPLMPRFVELIAGLEKEKGDISASKSTVDEQIAELELRHDIGELDDAGFEAQVADLRNNAAGANDRIAAIDADLGELGGGRDKWIELAGPAGHYTPPPPPADELHHAARVDIKEDVSTVFGGPGDGPATVRVPDAQDEIAIETAEVAEDEGDVVSADVQFATPSDLGGDIVVSESVSVAADGDVVVGASEVEIEIGAEVEVRPPATPAAGTEADAGSRRALLIYQESTAEEQIYPFTNDQLTIGRGRENDIQIKNDSKVSRYHCKLFRRGNNFYIEDIKSSNGTLVNGELITDRRLFGGEEIVVGETYFRFRIME